MRTSRLNLLAVAVSAVGVPPLGGAGHIPASHSATPPSFQRRGFSLIEVLVVIAIIALLAALLLPALNRSRGRSRAVVCASQIRQVWMAVKMYSQDWDGKSPIWLNGPSADRWTYWRNRVLPYAPNTNIFMCPLIPKGGLGWGSYCNYGINAYLSETLAMCGQSMSQPLARWNNPSETIALSENADGDWVCEPRSTLSTVITLAPYGPFAGKLMPWSVAGYTPPAAPYYCSGTVDTWGQEGRWYTFHDKVASVCFLDGHVELMKPEEVFATVNGVPFYYWITK